MSPSTQCARTARTLHSVFTINRSADVVLPAFLVPAFASRAVPGLQKEFSTSSSRRSKIGSAPLLLPPNVTFEITRPPPRNLSAKRTSLADRPATIDITGPLGKLSYQIPSYMTVDVDDEKRTRTLKIIDKNVREQREIWGTARAYLKNHILGVSEGHVAILRLVGVGYRATIESKAETVEPEYEGQRFVSLKVGYSHPIELGVPLGVKASTPQPTRILLEGIEKEVVKSFAAQIRKWRVPEPYKGKGIFVNDETIKLKAKKIK